MAKKNGNKNNRARQQAAQAAGTSKPNTRSASKANAGRAPTPAQRAAKKKQPGTLLTPKEIHLLEKQREAEQARAQAKKECEERARRESAALKQWKERILPSINRS